MKTKLSIFWFRRDLRLEDNAGLAQALASGYPVLPIFIFDENILNHLDDKKDRRVDYIHQALSKINLELKLCGSRLSTFYGNPRTVFKMLVKLYDIQSVFCNRDYEPQAIQRDTEIYNFFKSQNIPFRAFKDQVIFDKNEVLKMDGTPYTVYTPYSKKWKELLTEEHYKPYHTDYTNFLQEDFKTIHSLEEIGFEKTDILLKVQN